VTEKSMTDMQTKNGTGSKKPGDVLLTSEFDLNGAFTRMEAEFSCNRDTILAGFADEEGRICNCLHREEFMRKLFSVTDELTRGDVQVW
jgi:hypothetical protein